MSDNIDMERPPAVLNLRSRFEQLSVEKSPKSLHRHASGGQGGFLTPGAPESPRSRRSSNTQPDGHADTHHLRASSSSSDLEAATKRPPPPPPTSRSSKILPASSTPASPLLRPVPIPPGSPHIGSSSRASNVSASTSISQESSGSVASPRHQFASPSSRQVDSVYPDVDSTSSVSRPPVPPRPTRSDPNLLGPSASLNIARNVSPFSDEEDSVTQPPLPIRKHHGHHVRHHNHPSAHSSESSINTSESDMSTTSLPPPPKSSLPPRPPARFRRSASPAVFEPSPSLGPPPLPVRRSTIAQPEEVPQSAPPRLPIRPVSIPLHLGAPDSPNPSPTDRKPLGSGRLPPPPTRTIGLGDKLPPPRRPPSPTSDEESGEEEDSKIVDTMPDRSRSSRRPPILSFRDANIEPDIHVHSYSGIASVAGTTAVVTHNHHIKIYDLSLSDIPVHTVDTKDLGHKDVKITSMEFRPSAQRSDRGFVLWLGTKEGHIFELDARTGLSVASKHSAHLHPITHIFRHGRSMVSLDDSGKGLIFSPDASGADISLQHTQPRVVRVAEKQEFVKILGGKLWTASRSDYQLSGVLKIPIVRVYDIFTPANAMKAVVPTEYVGAVKSATIVPSLPGFVYMSHEAGSISVWALETEDGFPRCVDVMRIATSDVMSVEGVNDRLWAGGRSGMISAFDVSQKPWVETNCWAAHPGLPVMTMAVDHYGIDKIGRLCVVSVGRDEQLRLWDGLLGLDWVDDELLKQEHSFSRPHDLKVLLVSWNCDAARPDSMTGDPANVSFLTDVLRSVDSPDIVSFGFQEVIDLESRKMVAKNLLMSQKKDGSLSEKVTGAYRRWFDRLNIAMRQAMPPDEPYTVIHTESLIGLFSCIFVKTSERGHVRDASITTIKRGMGGRYGNKGGIVSRFVIEDSSICLINCHLAAGQNALRARNADVAGMLEEKSVFPETHFPFAYVGGGDGTMVLDHEIVFVNGDMNYRIDHRRDAIVAAIRSNDLNSLLAHDQLLREIKFNRACRFRGFSEGPLLFAPTYKYDRRTDDYDTSEKHRAPAWCDRVLWRARIPHRVTQLHYQRYEVNVSDHRPISAAFAVTVKSIKHDIRQQVKAAVQAGWVEEQIRLLGLAKQFYVRQALI